MRWKKEEEIKLKKLYSKKSISIKKIIKLLGRSPASIHNKITYLGIKKTRSPRKFKFPSKLTLALARIHAHVCGDGNLYRCKEKDCYGYLGSYKLNSHRYRYGIQYTNMNPLLIKEFMIDTEQTFRLKPYYNSNGNFVKLKSRDVWSLMKELGAGKSRDWFISQKIIEANKEIKKSWIKAFFDDEACFDANGRIRVRSVNRRGMNQVMQMLKEFLPSHITPEKGHYPDDSVYLNINKNDAAKYFSKIGSLRYRNSKNG